MHMNMSMRSKDGFEGMIWCLSSDDGLIEKWYTSPVVVTDHQMEDITQNSVLNTYDVAQSVASYLLTIPTHIQILPQLVSLLQDMFQLLSMSSTVSSSTSINIVIEITVTILSKIADTVIDEVEIHQYSYAKIHMLG
jgi:hypothetical protein